MPAVQIRLLPDARPLVERLGEEFFRALPTHPGVYLLRDDADAILYIGKAKNLRKRLGSYRVANPDRLPRRLLRLIHRARKIEWQPCADEAAALARERELLLSVKPRFNRAGMWPAPPKFLAWRDTEHGLEFAILGERAAGWECHGPLGGGAAHLRAILIRTLWAVLHPARGMAGMPAGWFAGRLPGCALLPWREELQRLQIPFRVHDLLEGDVAGFAEWILASMSAEARSFDRIAVEADLESLAETVRVKSA